MKLTIVYDDEARTLEVHPGTVNTRAFMLIATSETSGKTRYNEYRDSKTWNFERQDNSGVRYRIQIQRLEPEVNDVERTV
jgi:hypothetical protein